MQIKGTEKQKNRKMFARACVYEKKVVPLQPNCVRICAEAQFERVIYRYATHIKKRNLNKKQIELWQMRNNKAV